MVIANFREYTAVLRDVYSRDAMGEIGAYYQALTNSGEELKQQKLKLLEQIGARKREIDRQAQLIRTTTDKKADQKAETGYDPGTQGFAERRPFQRFKRRSQNRCMQRFSAAKISDPGTVGTQSP